MEHHSISSQNIFNPVCPWAVLKLFLFLLLLSVIAVKVFQLDSAWALAFSKLLEATTEVSSPPSEALMRLLNPVSVVVPPNQQQQQKLSLILSNDLVL